MVKVEGWGLATMPIEIRIIFSLTERTRTFFFFFQTPTKETQQNRSRRLHSNTVPFASGERIVFERGVIAPRGALLFFLYFESAFQEFNGQSGK